MKRYLLFALLFATFSATAQPVSGVDAMSTRPVDTLMLALMNRYGLPGGQLAISYQGRLIYNRGFGYKDQAQTEPVTTGSRFRLASVSKPITGIAVMKLIEDGRLGIDDTVFGADKILNRPYYLNAITDQRLYKVTVRQLLQHTGGWDRDISCDGQNGCDPISFPLHVTQALNEGNPMGDSTAIRFLLTKGLQHNPGSTYAYSNIGYLVLGKVIEKISGMRYEEYVRTAILEPAHMCDMHLGRNLITNKLDREVEYNGTFTTASCYGNGQQVPWQYGGWNLEAMNAHGGWVCTAADLVRLMLAVDGFNTVSDILSASTRQLMTTPSTANANYAMGWAVNSADNWWHTGSLDGTYTEIVRANNGYTWAVLFNNRSYSAGFEAAVDNLGWNCIAVIANMPAHNIMPPDVPASNLTLTPVSPTSVTLGWTNGSGDGRLVTASTTSVVNQEPVHGTVYSPLPRFGQGSYISQIVPGTHAIYAGNGNSVTITGLDPAQTYRFDVYEYFNNATTAFKYVYRYGCDTDVEYSPATGLNSSHVSGVALSPNPAGPSAELNVQDTRLAGTQATLVDAAGHSVKKITLQTGNQKLDLSALSPGLYLLRLQDGRSLRVARQ